MTGYGKAILNVDNREYQVEIKSVNHRYLDISIKIPRTISYLEEKVKQCISEKIKRGKVDVFITFENNSQEGKNIKINKELAHMYIEQLRELANEEKILDNIGVIDISKFPDVLTIKTDENDETIEKELIQVTKEATEKIIDMKEIEGNKITKDLLIRIEKIEKIITEISQNLLDLLKNM